jgi:two-component system response regulator AtoC
MKNVQHHRKLLIIDDEENMRHVLSVLAGSAGYQTATAADGQAALELLAVEPFDFILCDIKMPRMDGMAFLKAVKSQKSQATIIMMSAYGTIDLALAAMKAGAYDFISKPFKADEVLMALKKAEERENLRRENLQLRDHLAKLEGESRFASMVGESRALRQVFNLATKVARFDTTVLITGESGTGKELIARGIHFASPRADRPLVPVNCGSIPETLLESELFGHLKGAFTGADRTHRGLFEEADGGTIFLDEVGELPVALQVKILRVLQESEIRPVGSTETRKVDARVIAATSRNLEEEIERGRFREDLFYRLNVMPIHLPPLREHPEDIPFLCRHFIARFNEKLGLAVEGVSPAAMAELLGHSWPGNVRELENALERAMVLSEGPVLPVTAFQPAVGSRSGPLPNLPEKIYSLKEAKKIWEKSLICQALEATGGNRSRAAELLELSFPSLLDKIKKYGVKVKGD